MQAGRWKLKRDRWPRTGALGEAALWSVAVSQQSREVHMQFEFTGLTLNIIIENVTAAKIKLIAQNCDDCQHVDKGRI